MTTIVDPKTQILKLVERCRSCGAHIYWSTTDAGKLCPFDLADGQPTRESHFKTCNDPKRWSKRP